MRIDPVWQEATQQQVYRRLLDAIARPGKVLSIATGRSPARLAILATLLDDSVSLADPGRMLDAASRHLLRAAERAPDQADFVLGAGSATAEFEPRLGDLENPERSATLILQVEKLGAGKQRLELSGPGVRGHAELYLDGLHPDWLHRREDWNAAFPMGVDILLVDNGHVTALPRTTRVESG